jgi:crotonobetainyl-CoA:carnitine CoA-transferase CaiB-like acyl-CoA transferase
MEDDIYSVTKHVDLTKTSKIQGDIAMGNVAVENGLPGPLEGVRVIEYGVYHAGPGAGAILGDMGADVIKIESGNGDPERYWTDVGGVDFSMPGTGSLSFEVSNRSKRAIYLDINTDKGREIFHRLVAGADVFLTNLRKSTKAKLGIDYESIAKINPRIIHANVSGYGPEGPMSDLGAFDPLGMARSGMLFITGSSEPVMMYLGILDQATAISTSHAILSALLYRERHGIGQEIHVSLYGTALWLMHFNFLLNTFIKTNHLPSDDRNLHSPLRNVFCCKDGKWIMGTHHPESKYWPTLCKATDMPELINDPCFATEIQRKTNCCELIAIFDKVFATKTCSEWMEILQPLGLMFCPIQTITEVPYDPQALVNGYAVPFDHPRLGRVMVPGYPTRFSACSAGMRCAAPLIGQNTDEVLQELGYGQVQLDAMRKDDVIR